MMASELRRPESTQKSGRAECFIILNEEKRQLAVLQATPCLAFSNFTVQSSSRILWRVVGPTSARRAAIHPYIHTSILSFAASSESASALCLSSVRASVNPHVHPSSRSLACPCAMLHFCITRPPSCSDSSVHPSINPPAAGP